MKKLFPILMSTFLMVPSVALADEDMGMDSADDAMATSGMMAETTPVAEPEPESDGVDGLSWELLASGFYQFNTARVSGPGYTGNFFSDNHGFGLNFAGANASYTGDKFGVTIDLRFGSAAGALTPLAPLKQGYVTWLAHEKLTLDMGFFDTIFGAEVADEWHNVNFTRGALYTNAQPFNHLGMRMGLNVSDDVGITFLVVNGGVAGPRGAVVDTGIEVPAFGGQVSLAPSDKLGLVIGAMSAPNGSNGNKNWNHFVDVVLNYSSGDLTLVLNGDVTIDPEPAPGADLALTGGVSLAALYQLNDKWGAGGRVEFLDGNDNSGAPLLVTGTATLRYAPVKALILTIEPRVEYNDSSPYAQRDGGTNKVYFGIILGASAHIGS